MSRLSKRALVAVGFAAIATIVQGFYWASAVATAERIIEFDGLYWRTSPPGALLPWPQESGLLQALSPVSATDQAIYFMIRSNLYIALFVALTLLAAALGHMVGGALFH
jgi:hypothetical protein